MTEIFIIRHGETDLNKQKIVQGQGVDASLNELGRKQGKAFYDFYKAENFEVVLTSALIRTQQTVAPFIEAGLPTEAFAEINEIDWGVHEGKKSTPTMIEDYRSLIENWKSGNFDARLEEGESAQEMADRITVFVNHLRKRKEKKILVCCHGRAMRCLMCILKGQHLREMENYHHSNTGLYKVNYENDEFIFVLENDVQHLEAAELATIKWG